MKPKTHLAIAQALAQLLDYQFGIGKFKFGLDPIIGLVPGIGDVLTLGFSAYLFFVAHKLNLPRSAKTKILTNIFIDFLLSIIPVVGDLGDFVYRSNARNWAIIQKHTKIKIEDAEIVE